jgi:hypothetical protein
MAAITTTFAAGLLLVQAITLQPDFALNPSPLKDGRAEIGQRLSPHGWSTVPGMSAQIGLESPGMIDVVGHLGFQIEGPRCKRDQMVMIGVVLAINGRLLRAPIGTMSTRNVTRRQHYADVGFAWSLPLEPGDDLVEIKAWGDPLHPECRAYHKQGHHSGATIKVWAE